MSSTRELLVTTALPYANGSMHLGHILEHIQSDVWVRFQKLRGHTVHFICGSDAHGTPIMLNAAKKGLSPEAMVSAIREEHMATLKSFNIHYDNFHTTHSPENEALATSFFKTLQERGDIAVREIEQAFDAEKNLFLPDRYVKGDCPRCHTPDQYGDSCEQCGATYSPLDLKNPKSVLSGSTPIAKRSTHYFFQLPHYEGLLKNWLDSSALQPQLANKLREWFDTGLTDWDISRDAPYFGFLIPGTSDKYFYVWLDAPIGYIASFMNYCKSHPEINFDAYWRSDASTELYHFIGKDILYFHGLFWPALLSGAGYRLPTNIFTHGFLTVNGQKMSKSRGTFITAANYLSVAEPDYLRYYFCAKLSDTAEDIDFQLSDFVTRTNSDLVGKFVNIASRCSSFLQNYFDNQLAADLFDNALYAEFIDQGKDIAQALDTRQYSRAIREIMLLADKANQFIDLHKPWVMAKEPTQREKLHQVCTLSINLFRLLALYLKPITPTLVERIEAYLNTGALSWETTHPLLNHALNPFKPLLSRLDKEIIQKMTEPNETNTPLVTLDPPLAPEISVDDFAKIDLRIVKIIAAESIPEADKLLKLTVDLGGQHRTIFAGIKSAYTPESLVGKCTVIVANLAPRKMRFGLSEGMVLAAGPGGSDLWILEPHEGAQPGMKVK